MSESAVFGFYRYRCSRQRTYGRGKQTNKLTQSQLTFISTAITGGELKKPKIFTYLLLEDQELQ